MLNPLPCSWLGQNLCPCIVQTRIYSLFVNKSFYADHTGVVVCIVVLVAGVMEPQADDFWRLGGEGGIINTLLNSLSRIE